MNLKRLTARVAGYMDSITAARRAGMTWAEIGDRVGVPGEAARKAFARARAAVHAGRLVPLEQAPLPDPQATATVRTISAKPYAAGSGAVEQHQQERPARPGFKRLKID